MDLRNRRSFGFSKNWKAPSLETTLSQQLILHQFAPPANTHIDVVGYCSNVGTPGGATRIIGVYTQALGGIGLLGVSGFDDAGWTESPAVTSTVPECEELPTLVLAALLKGPEPQ